jgi:hypothetical protein
MQFQVDIFHGGRSQAGRSRNYWWEEFFKVRHCWIKHLAEDILWIFYTEYSAEYPVECIWKTRGMSNSRMHFGAGKERRQAEYRLHVRRMTKWRVWLAEKIVQTGEEDYRHRAMSRNWTVIYMRDIQSKSNLTEMSVQAGEDRKRYSENWTRVRM